jgi:ferredoxin
MRVIVDLNRCQAYGQCCFADPRSFQLKGEVLVYDPTPPEERRRDIERAMNACPVRAIRVQFDAETDS